MVWYMLKRMKKNEFDKMFALMAESFPSCEHRTYDEQRAFFDNSKYTVYAAWESEELKAFIAVWDFDDFRYIEHFAVNPKMRNGGVGGSVLKEVAEMSDKMLCLEAELPETDIAKRRICFYERNGFFLNEYSYIQPAITKGERPVPLVVMTSERTIDKDEFEKIRDVLYKEVYGVLP